MEVARQLGQEAGRRPVLQAGGGGAACSSAPTPTERWPGHARIETLMLVGNGF